MRQISKSGDWATLSRRSAHGRLFGDQFIAAVRPPPDTERLLSTVGDTGVACQLRTGRGGIAIE